MELIRVKSLFFNILISWTVQYLNFILLTKLVTFFFVMYIYFWDRERQSMNGGGSERGRHRIWNRLQALSCQHRAWCGARTHGPQDHDLSRSRPLNRLSHPGAPGLWPSWKENYLVQTCPYDHIQYQVSKIQVLCLRGKTISLGDSVF